MEIKQTKDINGYSVQLDISHYDLRNMASDIISEVNSKLTDSIVEAIIQNYKQETVDDVLNQDLGKVVIEKVADKLLKLLQKETK